MLKAGDIIAFVVLMNIIIFPALQMNPYLLSAHGQEDHHNNSKKLYSLAQVIGSNRIVQGQFNGPTGLATDSLGNLYVVDSGNKRVQKFSNNGTFLAMWNISDTDPHSLYGIVVDVAGKSVYVADFQSGVVWALSESSNNKSALPLSVQQFNQEPYHKALRSPFDVAIDPNTNDVYVTASSDGIRKYAPNGTLISQFNENYQNDSRVQLHHTTGVDIDSDGNVYVLAADNPLVNASFVQVFSSNGTFLKSWGGNLLKHPNDIAIDSSNTVFIRDADSKVKVFTKNGTFLRQWGSSLSDIEINQLTGSVGIAFDPDDDNVAYLSDPGNSLVKKYTKDGRFISSIGLASSADGQFEDPQDIEFDSRGNIYVADLQNHRIQKFTPNGTFITKWGSYCEINAESNSNYGPPQFFCLDPDGPQGPLERGDGQFSSPVDIAIDSKDDVYILDGPDNMRIEKFTSDGKFVTKFNINAENKTSEPGGYVRIAGIVVDSQDNVYAAVDYAFPSIQKFSNNGTYMAGWNLPVPKTLQPPPLEDMQFLGNITLKEYLENRTSIPWRIAIDSHDNVYAAAIVNTFWGNYHIQKISNDGAFLGSWGQAGWCREDFGEIQDMAFDFADNLYIVDVGNDRISKYSSDGTFLTLLYPEDIGVANARINAIAFDRKDNLYITTGNSISVFEPNARPIAAALAEEGRENGRTSNNHYYYEVSLMIDQGSSAFVPTYSRDARLVCGIINAAEKNVRFELLADSIHDDANTSNQIELIIPDEYISGIYQIKTDNGQEVQFEKHAIDNRNNASLLQELDLSSNREYTSISFIAPEKVSVIDIYAANVVPEFRLLAVSLIMTSAISAILVATRKIK